MTAQELYTSLKQLYKNMMFPKQAESLKWTMTEIDQLDVHFFYDLLETEDAEPQENEVYLSELW